MKMSLLLGGVAAIAMLPMQAQAQTGVAEGAGTPAAPNSPTPQVPQPAQTPDATADGGQLQDIVVTAEKTQNTEQRTPIAMTVATGAELVANGVTDANALPNIAPTLNIAQNNQNTLITIRGVSSRDYTETGNPAVAISIDNFYLQNGTALNVGFFDLDRIEVLRGPQGTLYGRNATAGAINIQTAKPTDRLEYSAAAEYGYKNQVIVEAMANLPLTDTLAFRVAGSVHERDAYRDNGPLVNKGGNDDVSQALRAHLLWEPDTRFSALLTGEITHVGGVGAVIKNVPYADVNDDDTLDVGDPRNFDLNTQGFIDLDIATVRGALSYDFGFATLSYFGGYRNQTLRRTNDQDGGVDASFAFPTDQDIDTQNHELRIASNGDNAFGYQAGVYYFKESTELLTYFQILGGAAPVNFYTFDYDVEAKSYAGFGQVYWKPIENLKISAGARYTQEEKTQVGYNDIAGTFTQLDNDYDEGKDTYHLGVDYQVTPRNLVYAKFDTGFKAGGFQNGFNYGPETIKAYEIGTKNRFFGNTLELNADAFLYNYSDLQTQQNDPATAISRIFNAGKARIWGVEVEANWLLTPNDRIDASVNYLHARYTDFLNNGVQFEGNALPQAPDWSLQGGYQHDFFIGNGKLTARVQSRFQSRSFFSFRNIAQEQQDEYTKTDFSITYVPAGAGLSLSAYVRNIEDSTILTTAEEASYAGGYLVQFADPRTWGGRVSVRF